MGLLLAGTAAAAGLHGDLVVGCGLEGKGLGVLGLLVVGGSLRLLVVWGKVMVYVECGLVGWSTRVAWDVARG